MFVIIGVTHFLSYPQDPSHYKAAHELMETIHRINGIYFIDTIINRVMIQEPKLKKHRKEIYTLLNDYLNSQEYRETRAKAIMYYFSEKDIVDINTKISNPSFFHSTQRQETLVKKYQRLFTRLEALFIQYLMIKLNRKYR